MMSCKVVALQAAGGDIRLICVYECFYISANVIVLSLLKEATKPSKEDGGK